MIDFLTQIIRTLQNASKKQIGELLLILTLIAIGVALYERWTASFRLSKLQRAASVVESLAKAHNISTDRLNIVSTAIIAQLQEVICPDHIAGKRQAKGLRFLVGLTPWIALSLFFLPGIIRKGDEMHAIWGAWAFGVITSFCTMFFPEVYWPWFHLLVYPFVVLFSAFIVGLVAGFRNNVRHRLDQEKEN